MQPQDPEERLTLSQFCKIFFICLVFWGVLAVVVIPQL